MSKLEALLWDVDGTLAETERDGHRHAFNLAFEACGLPWRWDDARYGELLRITGGRERLLHDLDSHPDAPSAPEARIELVRRLHETKNAFYGEIVRQARIPLRPGVLELFDECRARGVPMGITTTTSRVNVDALMRSHLGDAWNRHFAVIVCGEDVASKKPEPDVFLHALRLLDIGPLAALAIEDSPGGVAAARAADVPVVVTRSVYFAASAIEGAIAIGPGLDSRQGWTPALRSEPNARGRVTLDDLLDWRWQMDTVSQY